MKIRDCMKHNVVSIPVSTTLEAAAAIFVERHVGLLPVLNGENKPVGVLGLRDLLKLILPSFINFIDDFDFVHDFGAVENARPTPEVLNQPVGQIMRPVTTVTEDSGLLRAYALMILHEMHDLPVVNAEGRLVGIASRVDLGTAILRSWKREA